MSVDHEFVAGHYTVTFNGVVLGHTEVGFNLNRTFHREDIRIDKYGDVVVDAIYRGFGFSVDFELSSWLQDAIDELMNPMEDTAEGTMEDLTIGQVMSEGLAKPLVLIPVSGVNVRSKRYTFLLAAPDANHGSFALNTKLRRFRCNFTIFTDRTSGVQYSVA